MTRKEYKEILNYELYRVFEMRGGKLNPLEKLRIKYFQPNTNCMYLARKMWFCQKKGRLGKLQAKLLYLKIQRRYGCIIFPTAEVGRGFHITHPTGIVLGNCKAGKDFVIYQNCSVGEKKQGDDCPVIGNNVQICTNSVVLGHIRIVDNVKIGAQSLVLHDINESGIYAGNPLRKIKDMVV